MGWTKHWNQRYFRKYVGRKDGKDITIFYGRGPEAVAESERHEARMQTIQAYREMKRQDKLIDLQVKALSTRIHAEIAEVLEPKGFHRVHRIWAIKGQGRRSPKDC